MHKKLLFKQLICFLRYFDIITAHQFMRDHTDTSIICFYIEIFNLMILRHSVCLKHHPDALKTAI
jgi:hypothetical protein